MPADELGRILKLAEYDLDYLDLKEDFSGLARLATLLTGTAMSHINLIDAFNQWTIGDHGLPGGITPREDTVCHYTIAQDGHFEVTDLSQDDRFKEKNFVKEDPLLRYYYGVPLKADGLNIGSLCVLDREVKQISPEKAELLNVLAMEVVRRLQMRRLLNVLTEKLGEARTIQKTLAHDIRGPVGGVMSLAEIIHDQGEGNDMKEVLECIGMMQSSCRSILDLTNEILSSLKTEAPSGAELYLYTFRDKLEQLYTPQARSKDISFTVSAPDGAGHISMPKNKLLQISGNLISNAIKFTNPGGVISVSLEVDPSDPVSLKIRVTDSGIGMDAEQIAGILDGQWGSTTGEQGFGFGLGFVKHLVEELKGTFHISSVPGEGSVFEVTLPLPANANAGNT